MIHSAALRHCSSLRYTLSMGLLRQLSRWLRKQKPMTTILAGHTAPDFSLKALGGQDYTLRTLLQRGPVVAAFFKISCPVCQFTFPFLERLHQRYAAGGITILGISQDDARDTKDFCQEFGVTFPALLDVDRFAVTRAEEGYPVSNAYGLTTVPTIFLVAPDGVDRFAVTRAKVKVSSMGFDRKDLEAIAVELAERRKMPRAPLFFPTEIVPANKPG